MEIERKFLIKSLPENLHTYPFHLIEQAYLNTDPVIRIRKEDENYYLTYKGKGFLAREEYNLPLNEASYNHLKKKADGNIIGKKRYLISLEHPTFLPGNYETPLPEKLLIELDEFYEPFSPLFMAEVEFDNLEVANGFIPPHWFLDEVTMNPEYHNSTMSKRKLP